MPSRQIRLSLRSNKKSEMMRKWCLYIIGVLPLWVQAQTLSLDECLTLARDNYPAVEQYGLIDQTRQFTLANAAKGWLPQVSASAGLYGFTDIVDAERLALMGMDMDNHVGTASLTVRQNIFDGGQIAAGRRVTRAQSEVQERQLDVTMYGVDDRVQQLFFGILMLDDQTAQNELLQQDLEVSYQSVESLMKGGLANQSDLDAIKVEQIKAQQQRESLLASRRAYAKMLGIFIGKEGDVLTLARPSTEAMTTTGDGERPELRLYAAQDRLLDAQRKQLNAKLWPTVSAFGIGLWHTDVTELVKSSMLIGGISLSWNFGALYTRKNDLRKLDTERLSIDSQRRTFLFNNRLQSESSNGTIESLRAQIAQDEEIVRLRESIREKSAKKVEEGTQSVNELVRDVNAVSQARQQKALHEIQLMKELYNFRHIVGK